MQVIDAQKKEGDAVLGHTKHVGQIIVNLQALEFLIRAYLQNVYHPEQFQIFLGDKGIATWKVGTPLPESYFTSYDSLKDLIKKFNRKMEELGKEKIDPTLNDLRDAFAHGRIFSTSKDASPYLVKFSKERKKQVQVETYEVLTPDWMHVQNKRVLQASKYVGSLLGTTFPF